jgi:CBS domain-containing protein
VPPGIDRLSRNGSALHSGGEQTTRDDRFALEVYPALRQLRVVDAMHPGLISCSLDTPLRTVARLMATYRVHAILVTAHGEEQLPGGELWGVVSDADLLRAAESGDVDEQSARTIAATPVQTIASSDELARAAQLMVEHDVSHLIVIERRSERPIGVLSTLDIARALAGFPELDPGGR